MSLFQYGLKCVSSTSQSYDVPQSVPNHLPQHHESGLSIEEHANTTISVADLSDPQITTNKRKKRGKYAVYTYTEKDRARIGKYASDNGNERARKRFISDFPTQSTIRNFKKLYWSKVKEERTLK